MQNTHHQCFRAVKAITKRTHRNYQWPEFFSSGNPKLGDKEKRISKETVKEESETKQEIAVLDIKTKRTELQGGQSDPEGKNRSVR